MKKLPTPEQLVEMWESGLSGKRNWFTRYIKQYPVATQEEIWEELAKKGFHKPFYWNQKAKRSSQNSKKVNSDKSSESSQKIIWTEEEWEKLAEIVWRARKNNPAESLISLCKKAMSSLPKDRHRTLRGFASISTIVPIIQKMDEEFLEAKNQLESSKEELHSLKEEYQAIEDLLSEQQDLSNISDEDLLQKAGQRVIDLLAPEDILKSYSAEMLLEHLSLPELAGGFVQSIMDNLLERDKRQQELVRAIQGLSSPDDRKARQVPQMPMPRPSSSPSLRSNLPRVTVIGLLPNQINEIRQEIGDRAQFNFVDKNRSADVVPANQDIIVLMASKIKHALQNQAKKHAGENTEIMIHHGGISRMIEKLDKKLPVLQD